MDINKIYNENCLDTMARMTDKFVDLTLTDPPYGINLEYDTYEDTEENWYNLMDKVIPEIKRVSKMVIMPVCQIARMGWIYEKFPPDWLICWYKGSSGQRSYIGFSDWEPHLVYGKTYTTLKMHDYFQTVSSPKMGSFYTSNVGKDGFAENKKGHPCPKPEEWAEWIIKRASKKGHLIYDPFMGSGTVGKVAFENDRNYIGSEISKEYCKIIEKRIPKNSNKIENINSLFEY
ncbi:MAG: DNA-methyltransferase [bacterium]